jgi:hypothetical protein
MSQELIDTYVSIVLKGWRRRALKINDNVSHWTTNNSRRRMNSADPPTHVDKGVSLFNR